MGKLNSGSNSKKEAGMAKKDEAAQKKQEMADRERAKAEELEWSQGANTKRTKAEEEKALKADEAARRRREKEELLAAEESEIGADGGSKGKKLIQLANKKSAGKKKNDISLLEDALQSSADKAAKKKKADLIAKKKREEEAQLAKAAEAAKQLASLDPLLKNTEAMMGGSSEEIGREANRARMEAAEASGIDAALGHLNVSGNPVSSAKALYAEFEARMMPIVKDENPGLRLSQYKEKIFSLWKRSPENPANRPDKQKY